MRNKSGSALIDYIIPTAVVGVVFGLGLWGFVENQTLLNFVAASGKMEVSVKDSMATVGKHAIDPNACMKGGCLGGTPGKPVQVCTGGKCIIDFGEGEFILKNIPEDFINHVESTSIGTTTDDLLAMFTQIANQMDDPATIEDEGEDFKNLANMGHLIARYENEIEAGSKKCYVDTKTADEQRLCLKSAMDKINLDMPPELNGVFDDTYLDAVVNPSSLSSDFLSIGSAINNCNNKNPPSIECNDKTFPNVVFLKSLEKITDPNSKYSDVHRSIAQELSNYIDVMAYDTFVKYNGTAFQQLGFTAYKPITGEPVYVNLKASWDEINQHKTSLKTNLSSALICATKHNHDDLSSCH